MIISCFQPNYVCVILTNANNTVRAARFHIPATSSFCTIEHVILTCSSQNVGTRKIGPVKFSCHL